MLTETSYDPDFIKRFASLLTDVTARLNYADHPSKRSLQLTEEITSALRNLRYNFGVMNEAAEIIVPSQFLDANGRHFVLVPGSTSVRSIAIYFISCADEKYQLKAGILIKRNRDKVTSIRIANGPKALTLDPSGKDSYSGLTHNFNTVDAARKILAQGQKIVDGLNPPPTVPGYIQIIADELANLMEKHADRFHSLMLKHRLIFHESWREVIFGWQPGASFNRDYIVYGRLSNAFYIVGTYNWLHHQLSLGFSTSGYSNPQHSHISFAVKQPGSDVTIVYSGIAIRQLNRRASDIIELDHTTEGGLAELRLHLTRALEMVISYAEKYQQ